MKPLVNEARTGTSCDNESYAAGSGDGFVDVPLVAHASEGADRVRARGKLAARPVHQKAVYLEVSLIGPLLPHPQSDKKNYLILFLH